MDKTALKIPMTYGQLRKIAPKHMKDREFTGILGALLGGGLAAGGTALATRRKDEDGEDSKGRAWKVLAAGLAGAGVGGLAGMRIPGRTYAPIGTSTTPHIGAGVGGGLAGLGMVDNIVAEMDVAKGVRRASTRDLAKRLRYLKKRPKGDYFWPGAVLQERALFSPLETPAVIQPPRHRLIHNMARDQLRTGLKPFRPGKAALRGVGKGLPWLAAPILGAVADKYLINPRLERATSASRIRDALEAATTEFGKSSQAEDWISKTVETLKRWGTSAGNASSGAKQQLSGWWDSVPDSAKRTLLGALAGGGIGGTAFAVRNRLDRAGQDDEDGDRRGLVGDTMMGAVLGAGAGGGAGYLSTLGGSSAPTAAKGRTIWDRIKDNPGKTTGGILGAGAYSKWGPTLSKGRLQTLASQADPKGAVRADLDALFETAARGNRSAEMRAVEKMLNSPGTKMPTGRLRMGRIGRDIKAKFHANKNLGRGWGVLGPIAGIAGGHMIDKALVMPKIQGESQNQAIADMLKSVQERG